MARCVVCRRKKTNACGRCKSTVYCSKECQELDWPTHHILCRARAEISPRPSEDHVLGIFFPEFELRPRLVWVHIQPLPDNVLSILIDKQKRPLGVLTTTPQTRSYLAGNSEHWGLDDDAFTKQTGLSPFFEREFLIANPRNGARTPKRQLCIINLTNAGHCQYPSSLLPLVPWPAKEWRGPFVCLAVQAEERKVWSSVYADATLADFRWVLDAAMCWPADGVVKGTPMDDSGDEDDDFDDSEEPEEPKEPEPKEPEEEISAA